MSAIDVVLFGIGGYGAGYVRSILSDGKELGVRIVAAVDPFPAGCPQLEQLRASGVPVFDTPETFIASGLKADLAVVSTPIPFHPQQAAFAMRHGCHVLLEKPLAADVAGASEILRARDETGKICAVGFQWCFDRAMRQCKRDKLSGLFGRPLSMRSMTLWPRDFAYYKRGIGWAGKRFDAQGRPVMDSVASNATAHYLMNELWMLGSTMEGAADIGGMQCEVSRANDIGTFDTIALHGKAAGADVTYIASHAAGDAFRRDPMFDYRFENACLSYRAGEGPDIVARFKGGTEKVYRGVCLGKEDTTVKLDAMLCAIREGTPVPCPVETALCHVRAMDFVNAQPVTALPATTNAQKTAVFCEGLGRKLVELWDAS